MMTSPPRKPATVLIVDDEAGLRRVLERFLERHGYRVLSAGTAEAEEVRTWLDHHHCTVIRKPFNLKQVVDWVSSALHRDRSSGAMDA